MGKRVWLALWLIAALAISGIPASGRAAASLPPIVAQHWIIVEVRTGAVIAERSAREPVAMASLTKVMTAVVALERGDLEGPVRIVPEDLVGESSAGLTAGQVVTLRTLLYGLLLRSGNDAAMAIARAVGGSPDREDPAARQRLVTWMNEKAADLGLRQTMFRNPHGLDEPGHYSTAYDLAQLTRYALADPTFVEMFGSRDYEGEGFSWQHTNRLPLRYPGVIGGKTGWTDEAGLCLIEVAERAGKELIVVLLGSTFEAWYDDAATLLDYGWTRVDPLEDASDAQRLFDWWWRRTDDAVARGVSERSWVWGQPLGPLEWERYDDADGGRRLVRYYEKGRMELTHPEDVVDARWRVTGGRLAWELLSGWQQVGDRAYRWRGPSRAAVAGDPESPISYGTLGRLLAEPAHQPDGVVTARLLADGSRVEDPLLARYDVRYGTPFEETGHGIASVFVPWLEQRGLVWAGDRLRREPLFHSWLAIMGFPITEPYWVRVPIAGVERDVLVQCFERRCLTYTPSNPPAWRVEMGNIGLHYRQWLNEWPAAATVGGKRLA